MYTTLLVTLDDVLEALRDDRDHISLQYNAPTSLTFGVAQAGPGEFFNLSLDDPGKLFRFFFLPS